MSAATKTQIDMGPAATGKRGFLRRTLVVLALSLVASLAITATASATRIGAITNVSYSSAVIGAKITATGFTLYNFEYSTNETTWSSGPTEAVYANNGDVPIEPTLGGLRGGTKYFIRLAVNGVPTTPTAPPYPEFTTLAVEPPTIVAINDASGVFSKSATFAGKVKRPANSDPAFNISACRFEVVPDAQFVTTGFQGATVEVCEPSTPYKEPNGETELSAHLTGLSPATTYHLRLAIENAAPGAVTKEATHTFTTAAKVAAPIILAANDATELKINGGNASAKFSGEVQRPLGEDPALDVTCRFEFVTDAQFNANAPGEKFRRRRRSTLRAEPDHQNQRQCRRQTPSQRRSIRVRQIRNHLSPATGSGKRQRRRGQRSSQHLHHAPAQVPEVHRQSSHPRLHHG